MIKPTPEMEKKKQSFLAVIKWCSTEAGARVVFDPACTCPCADVDKKVITMPTRVNVRSMDSTLGTIIHEAMHIKHTPKWLNELVRDSIDKNIFNALEDQRIETYAVGQLRALKYFLKQTITEVRRSINNDIDLGYKVLVNIAGHVSDIKVFDDYNTKRSEFDNKVMLDKLKKEYRSIFTVTMKKSFIENVHELYKLIDEFRKVYGFPPADPSKKEQKQVQPIVGAGIGPYKADIRGEANGQAMQAKAGNQPAPGCGKDIEGEMDLSDILMQVDLNAQAKLRIKETLKKSLETVIDEGNQLNTDNLCALLTGDIDDVFIDTKIEKKTRTKVYFLMDRSGSMDTIMNNPEAGITGLAVETKRRDLAIAAFKAVEEVILEVKDMYGMDIDYENFVFADHCEQVKSLSQPVYVGGGTNIVHAFKKVISHVQKDDPANKRIVVVLTDGEIGSCDHDMVELINKEAQDIRVVIAGIGEAVRYAPKLIRHNIVSPNNAEAVLIEAFEECL